MTHPLITKKLEEFGQFSMHADGYNQAIEEVLDTISSKYLTQEDKPTTKE